MARSLQLPRGRYHMNKIKDITCKFLGQLMDYRRVVLLCSTIEVYSTEETTQPLSVIDKGILSYNSLDTYHIGRYKSIIKRYHNIFFAKKHCKT